MIQKIRRRFIIIAMASMFIVLLVLMLGINIANYVNINRSANERLNLIAAFDGQMPEFQNPIFMPDKKQDSMMLPPNKEAASQGLNRKDYKTLSQETPFNTRYFTVSISSDGTVAESHLDFIASISTQEAESVAQKLYSASKTDGFYDDYKYTSVETKTSSGTPVTMYIFLNCHQELRTFRQFLIASISISIAGLLLVFLLVLFFSKRMIRPIEESYRKQKRFITDASHELKTPLTIIDANTEIIEMEKGEDEWTTSIRNQVSRLTDLTNKMVMLSRMDEENVVSNHTDFSLSDAVADTVEPFLAVAKSKDLQLDLKLDENLTYHGDEGQIRQMVSLLMDNAIKYSNGRIRLTLKQSGRSRQILIWNTYEETSIGKKDEFFERFYRSDSSRNSKTGGHGIGLSIVQAIVVAHKGKITAKSEDGHSILISILL